VAADWIVYLSIMADAITLVAVVPLTYRYLRSWWSPFSVGFDLPPGSESSAQAGGETRVLLTIENRTPDVAFFSVGTRQPVPPGNPSAPGAVGFNAYRNYPNDVRFDGGQLEVSPFGKHRARVDLIPRLRGDFWVTIEVSEFFHDDKYPNWLRFRRRVLREAKPIQRPLVYSKVVHLIVASRSRPAEDLTLLGQMPLTEREKAVEAEIDRWQGRPNR
jgi:hypothetical protein